MNREKAVRLTKHAEGYSRTRGFLFEEVRAAIRQGEWRPTEQGRWETEIESVYNSDWNGRRFKTKKVRPIFVEEPGEIVVITVYVYYY